MRRYLLAARRYRWPLALIVALVWGAGLIAAYVEYSTTFESEAIVWGQRPPPQLATSADDPGLTVVQTPASQHASLLIQLFQTDSFLVDVLRRTLSPATFATTVNQRYLDDVRKRFHVQALGSNLLSVSFTARDPRTAREVLDAALLVRGERVVQARVASTAAVSALYHKELELAQTQALDAQKQIDLFNDTHPAPLSEIDQHRRDQLRLALDFIQIRLGDLRGRIDQAVLAPEIVDVSGMEFQVLDEPREETSPRGGTKTAASIASTSLVAGGALAALLIAIGGLLADRLAGAANVVRLAPARLFGTVPRVVLPSARSGRDLRAGLAAVAFGDGAARGPDGGA
jgi:uncharacterized protein involved in exopolysaccharide biosynthesis